MAGKGEWSGGLGWLHWSSSVQRLVRWWLLSLVAVAAPIDLRLMYIKKYMLFYMEILVRQKSPNRVVTEEAVNNDNSVVVLHPATMENLQFSFEDTILIKLIPCLMNRNRCQILVISAGTPKNLTVNVLDSTLSTICTFPLKKSVFNMFCYEVRIYRGRKYLARTMYFYGGVNRDSNPHVFGQIVDGTFWSPARVIGMEFLHIMKGF
ncbi:hypothetical protein T459_09174 [Capsicum annuum]|uniref:Uncharacterized protein n=1 Tax=Capsicum annuum TaxID=4072 RepID=A0A2G2ZYL7_CAPAN|nr:hypothetical protein T459_09174 [Capsicum annuum]